MKKRTIRLLLKWSFVPNTLLLATAMVDHFVWESRILTPLLVLYIALLVFVLVLLTIEDQPRHVRLKWHDQPRPHTIIYPKEQHHGPQ